MSHRVAVALYAIYFFAVLLMIAFSYGKQVGAQDVLDRMKPSASQPMPINEVR